MAEYYFMYRHQHLLCNQHRMDHTSRSPSNSIRCRFNCLFVVYRINSTMEYLFLCYPRFYKPPSNAIAAHIILFHVYIVCRGR